jgi:hypothetical protein
MYGLRFGQDSTTSSLPTRRSALEPARDSLRAGGLAGLDLRRHSAGKVRARLVTVGELMADNERLETDYLVIGAGAVGMAFVDALIDGPDVDVIMVDRRPAASESPSTSTNVLSYRV